jgi:hypothetical protein
MYQLRCIHPPITYHGNDWTANLWCRHPSPTTQAVAAAVVQALNAAMPPEAAPRTKGHSVFSTRTINATNESLRPLGFDFALIISQPHHPAITLLLGPRSTFQLYWQNNPETSTFVISDHLPHPPCTAEELSRQLDADWLTTFMAHGAASGPIEFSTSPHTIYKAWQKVPPSHLVRLASEDGQVTSDSEAFDNISDPSCLAIGTPAVLQTFIQRALTEHLQQLGHQRNMAIEVSGGIDSGLVMAAASQAQRQATGGQNRTSIPLAICNRYPYPEFRREALYQQALQTQFGFALSYQQGAHLLPFAGLLQIPPHDEPSVLSTSWGHLSTMHQHCKSEGIHTLLTGHGGDTLFGIPPETPVTGNVRGALPTLFSDHCRQTVQTQSEEICDYVNRRPHPWTLSGHWHPAMLDSAFINRVFYRDSAHSLTYTSGLISPDIVNGLHAYWQLSAHPQRSTVFPIQKAVAHAIFKDWLPESVWRRPGKVNHLGLVYRGLFNSRTDLEVLTSYLDVFAPLLEFEAKAMQKALQEAANGLQSGAGWITRMLALLAWAHAREHR